jgi:molybdopterin/thiamine biosynthesis adenylyltransferase
MVFLTSDILGSCQSGSVLSFVEQDAGDAYVPAFLFGRDPKHLRYPSVTGAIYKVSNVGAPPPPGISDPIVVHVQAESPSGAEPRFACWRLQAGRYEPEEASVVEIENELFSRVKGIVDTRELQDKNVLIIGVGSGGSFTAMELAKAGVGSMTLVDHDRVEVGNISRHICGLSDLGRLKTVAVRDRLLDKNPAMKLATSGMNVGWSNIPELRRMVDAADLVMCCTDNRESRLITNLVCLAAKRTCIYGGTFARAYGGLVIRVRPRLGMCYQCFIDDFPEDAANREIASPDAAAALGYWDFKLPVEAGLSLDIAPVAVMATKMAILELMRDRKTSLDSLHEDLPAPLYKWINRREPGSDYEHLPPLDQPGCEFRILAWYGVAAERNLDCPACGELIRNGRGTGLFGYSFIDEIGTGAKAAHAAPPS